MLDDCLLARSELAELSIAFLDAFPDGWELTIAAQTSLTFAELERPGDHGADVFGRHWPMVGDRTDALPETLLRVGVQYADGRCVTNISGWDRPAQGPVASPLRGSGSGRNDGSRHRQGYWITPLPPPGPVTIVCEWPIAAIPVTRHELAGEAIIAGAGRAVALFENPGEVQHDDRRWPLATAADVAWINDHSRPEAGVPHEIPPGFAAYGTLTPPRPHLDGASDYARRVIDVLAAHTAEQPWWLGYRDTGASDVVFPYAPRTTVCAHRNYVLVQAGAGEALVWREGHVHLWTLPDLIFPADRSWLLSTGAPGGDHVSAGGPQELIEALMALRSAP